LTDDDFRIDLKQVDARVAQASAALMFRSAPRSAERIAACGERPAKTRPLSSTRGRRRLTAALDPLFSRFAVLQFFQPDPNCQGRRRHPQTIEATSVRGINLQAAFLPMSPTRRHRHSSFSQRRLHLSRAL
jgi:hypothetical protein